MWIGVYAVLCVSFLTQPVPNNATHIVVPVTKVRGVGVEWNWKGLETTPQKMHWRWQRMMTLCHEQSLWQCLFLIFWDALPPPLPAYEKKETLMFVPLNQLQCSDSGDFQLWFSVLTHQLDLLICHGINGQQSERKVSLGFWEQNCHINENHACKHFLWWNWKKTSGRHVQFSNLLLWSNWGYKSNKPEGCKP